MNKLDLLPKPQAELLHIKGLSDSVKGDNESAREAYFAALTQYDEEDTPRNLVQIARVLRDLGFTYVREAIQDSPVINLGIARATLEESIALFNDAHTREEFDREAYNYLLAEHGASIGLLARMATVAGLLATDGDHARSADRQAIAAYANAAEVLKKSDNSYYRTSNLVNAARHETAFERPILGLTWFSRSVGVAAMSGICDVSNTKNCARTVADKAKIMFRPSAARRSVLARP